MPDEPLSEYDRILWSGRFALYSDRNILARWQQSQEEPSAVDLLALSEIERRNLDL
jgi:hypothetical protein